MHTACEILGKDLGCVATCDGLKAHFNEILNKSLEKIGNIKTIQLPVHSSLITQMLDIFLFMTL